MCPADGELEEQNSGKELCIRALRMLRDSDPGFRTLLEESSEAGCREALFFSGAVRYHTSGKADPETQRLLNDSGREGYSLYEFLSTYPADIADYFGGKKEFDDGLLERSTEWFSLPPEQKEYFRKRALSRFGEDLSGKGNLIFNTPAKYSDWTELRDSKGDPDASYSVALGLYENREFEACLDKLNISDDSDPRELHIAGKCLLALSKDKDALQLFRRSADEGHSGSAYEIYLLYDTVGKEEAMRYLDEAVMGNVREATNTLFDIYMTADDERPRILGTFASAFEKGNYDARACEGFIRFFGIGTDEDDVKALQCFEDAHGRCQFAGYVGFLLGYMYANGIGCNRLEERGRTMMGRYAVHGTMPPEESLDHIRKSIMGRGRDVPHP